MVADSGGVVNLVGTGRQANHTTPGRHQRTGCVGQGAAAAKGARDVAGTRGHATTDPLRFVGLLFVAPPINEPSILVTENFRVRCGVRTSANSRSTQR